MIATSLRFFFAIGVVFERVSPPPLCTQHNHTEQHLPKKPPIYIQQLKPYRAHKFQNRLDEINDVSANRHFPDGKKKKKCSSDFSNSSSST